MAGGTACPGADAGPTTAKVHSLSGLGTASGRLLAGTGKSAVSRALIRQRLYGNGHQSHEQEGEMANGAVVRSAQGSRGRAKPAADLYPTLAKVHRQAAYSEALDCPASLAKQEARRQTCLAIEKEAKRQTKQRDDDEKKREDDAPKGYRGSKSDVCQDMQSARSSCNAKGSNEWLLERLFALAATPYTQQLTGLVKRGVNVNATGWNGQTALAVAAARGHVCTVEALLDLGAASSLTTANSRGWTPLMLAATHGHTTVVRRLLEADCEPTPVDVPPPSLSTQDAASFAGDTASCINMYTERGAGPLSVAIERGHVEVAELVAEAGGVLGPLVPRATAEAGLRFNSKSSMLVRACWLVTDKMGAKQQADRLEKQGRIARQRVARAEREAAEAAAAAARDAARLAAAIGGLDSMVADEFEQPDRAARNAIIEHQERERARNISANSAQVVKSNCAAKPTQHKPSADEDAAERIRLSDAQNAIVEESWAAAAACDPVLQRARDEQAAQDERRRRLALGSPKHVVRRRRGAAGGPVGDVVWVLPGAGAEEVLQERTEQEEREYAHAKRQKEARMIEMTARRARVSRKVKKYGHAARKTLQAAFEKEGGQCPTGAALDDLCRICKTSPEALEKWFKDTRLHQRRLQLSLVNAGSPDDAVAAVLYHENGNKDSACDPLEQIQADLAANAAAFAKKQRAAADEYNAWLTRWGGLPPTDEERDRLIHQGETNPDILYPPPKPTGVDDAVFVAAVQKSIQLEGQPEHQRKQNEKNRSSTAGTSRPSTPASLLLTRRKEIQAQTTIKVHNEMSTDWDFAPPLAMSSAHLGNGTKSRISGRRTSVAVAADSYGGTTAGLLDGHHQLSGRRSSVIGTADNFPDSLLRQNPMTVQHAATERISSGNRSVSAAFTHNESPLHQGESSLHRQGRRHAVFNLTPSPSSAGENGAKHRTTDDQNFGERTSRRRGGISAAVNHGGTAGQREASQWRLQGKAQAGRARQSRSAGGVRNRAALAAAPLSGFAEVKNDVDTDVLAQCMRVARSYPKEQFEEVLQAELAKAAAAAEEKMHSDKAVALLRTWELSGKSRWEYAHNDLPDDVSSWDAAQVCTWLRKVGIPKKSAEKARTQLIDGQQLLWMTVPSFVTLLCPPSQNAATHPPPSKGPYRNYGGNAPAGDEEERMLENERQSGKRHHFYNVQAKELEDEAHKSGKSFWQQGSGRWTKVLQQALLFLQNGFDYEKYIKAEHAHLDPADNYEPLHKAILLGDALEVDRLLEGGDPPGSPPADPNRPTALGRSPLMLAVAVGELEILHMVMFAGGADPTLARLGVLPQAPEPEPQREVKAWPVEPVWGSREAAAVAAQFAEDQGLVSKGWQYTGKYRSDTGGDRSVIEFFRDVPRPLTPHITTEKNGVGAGRERIEWRVDATHAAAW